MKASDKFVRGVLDCITWGCVSLIILYAAAAIVIEPLRHPFLFLPAVAWLLCASFLAALVRSAFAALDRIVAAVEAAPKATADAIAAAAKARKNAS
jgi:hypothetical protein